MKVLKVFIVSFSFFMNLFSVNMSNARKLFRLFKSLLEYQKINAMLGKADSMSVRKLIFSLIPRIAFFFYWMFDHLIVMHKVNFYRGIELKWIMKQWAKCWVIANTTTIIGSILDLVELAKEEAKLVAAKRLQRESNSKVSSDDLKNKEKDIKK